MGRNHGHPTRCIASAPGRSGLAVRGKLEQVECGCARAAPAAGITVRQLRGSVSRSNVPNPDAYERANYYQMLQSWPVHH